MNFAIIGTNFISDRFCEAAASVSEVKIVAVYSRGADTGRAFAEKHGIDKVYTNLDEMLSDSDIRAVYVASPTMLHKEHSIKAMSFGKDVLCEKMIGASLEDFLEMAQAAKKYGRVLTEAMRPDFDPNMEIIANAVSRLGKIRRASFEYCQYSSRYDRFLSGELMNAFDPKMKNSALSDIGIYPLHFCVRLFGTPMGLAAKSLFLKGGFEGLGSAVLDYGDMIATVTYSKITESATPSVIDGELGSLIFDRVNAPTYAKIKYRNGKEESLPITPYENNMNFEISAFIKQVEKGENEFLRISDATMRLVDAIYKSAGISFPSE